MSDYNKMSPLFEYFKEEIKNTDTGIYKNLEHKIVLDPRVSKNELAIYLSILKESSFNGAFKAISHKVITNTTGILQPNQGKLIDKLESLGYIELRFNESREYKIVSSGEPHLPMKLEHFNGIKGDIKNYVNKLRVVILSNGNDKIPSYKKCLDSLGKWSRRQHGEIVSSFDGMLDVEIYESLKLGNVKFKSESKTEKTLEEQLDEIMSI